MEAHFLFLVWHFVQKSPYYSAQHLLKYSNCIHIMRKKMAVWIIQWTSVTGFCMTLTSLSSWVTWITRSGGHFLGCSVCVCAKLLHVCLTLCDPMDCGWPGSSVQGILQERMLEWVAISLGFPGNLPKGMNPHLLSLLPLWVGSLPPVPPGKPLFLMFWV